MKQINSKQKAQIRKYAQNIKPTFQIGSSGIHTENINAIIEGFNKKEILKIKVNREDKYDKNIVKEIATVIEKGTGSQVAGVIGTTIIIYKENKKLKKEDKFFKK